MKNNVCYIVSIDPSINFCGYAIHKNNTLIEYKLLRSSVKHVDFIEKSKYMSNKLKDVIDKLTMLKGQVQVITEIPQYWGVAGFMARESGAISKLMFLCGMIVGLRNNVITLTPQDWKGQLPKEVVNNRLRKIYPNVDIKQLNHNIVDAIGIGHYYITNKKEVTDED